MTKTILLVDDDQRLRGLLKDYLNKDDKVLFKGSRGMEMEKVLAGVFE